MKRALSIPCHVDKYTTMPLPSTPAILPYAPIKMPLLCPGGGGEESQLLSGHVHEGEQFVCRWRVAALTPGVTEHWLRIITANTLSRRMGNGTCYSKVPSAAWGM